MKKLIMERYKQYLPYLGFCFLGGLFVITRFWRLDTIPTGLHLDEAGMAYDAWCMANYGVDRYFNSMPLYLINYGGGQSILYAYLCAGLFKLFGYNIWLVRLPIICSSFLTVFFGMRIAADIFPDNRYLIFLTGGALIVCPYFILNSRYGIDCNLMLGLSTVFLYYFHSAVSKNKLRYYIMAGIAGGVTLYTYALSYLILPCYLLLSLIYCVWVKRFDLKKWVVMALPMGSLALPLIIVQIINIFDLPELKLGAFTFTKLEIYRVGEIGKMQWSNLVLALKCIFIGDEFNYTSVDKFFNLYGVTILLFVVGFASILGRLAQSIKKREADALCFIWIWFMTILLLFSCMLSNIYRINPVYFAAVLIAMEGIHVLCRLLKRPLSLGLCLVVTGVYLICFLKFGVYYYTGAYTRENYPLEHFEITVSAALDYLDEHPECLGKGTFMAQPDVYFALSRLAPPYELEIDPHIHGHWQYDYYRCGTLPEIEEGYNYIVRDIYTEYAGELRGLGYHEITYPNYSLFLHPQTAE